MSEKIDVIWKGDIFERRQEAALLEQYLESVWNRRNIREDSKGFVLAVDADYGMGKTFFLKKFEDQMAINHPVAYIDAWKDDLLDEPLIAILSTLENALKPYFSKKPVVEQQFKDVVKKAQKIGGLMAKGIAFRALGAIFTSKIVDFIADTISSDDTQIDEEDLQTRVNEAEKSAIEGAGKVAEIIMEESELRSRISKFKESQSAIETLKKALIQLVESLKTDDKYAPIVIIIDELDRCRPTYAIKLLEEVKHLFDVEGLVFVLGTNSHQLSKSVNKLYGADFDGNSYLSRFIDRTYKLREPNLISLVNNLISEHNLTKLIIHTNTIGSSTEEYSSNTSPNEALSLLLKMFRFSARDTIKLFNIIETISILVGNQPLIISYLIPLIIKEFWPSNFKIAKDNMPNEVIVYKFSHGPGEYNSFSPISYFEEFEKILPMNLLQRKNILDGGTNLLAKCIINTEFNSGNNCLSLSGMGNPKKYRELINSVCRFS